MSGLARGYLRAYRTEHGAEVDVILEMRGDVHAIEIKASKTVGAGDLSGLRSFREYYGRKHQAWLLYDGEIRKTITLPLTETDPVVLA